MRRFVAVMLFAILLAASATAQNKKSDREHEEFAGPVQNVRVEVAKVKVRGSQIQEKERKLTEVLNYGVQGNLTERSFDSGYLGRFNKSVYSFDSSGKRTEILYFAHTFSSIPPVRTNSGSLYETNGRLKTIWEFKHDDKGNRIEEIKYLETENVIRNVYVYDGNARIAEKTCYDNKEVRYRRVYIRNNKGSITEQIEYSKNGSIASRESYTYEFDGRGNWIKRVTSKSMTKNGQTYFEPEYITYRTITYYEAANTTIAVPKAGVEPTKVYVVPAGFISDVPYEIIAVPMSSTSPPQGVTVKSGILIRGQAVKRVEPVFPPHVNIDGVVNLEIVIDEAGRVIYARAITGHPLLKQAAVEAARQWKFGPTTFEGVPVKVLGGIAITFAK